MKIAAILAFVVLTSLVLVFQGLFGLFKRNGEIVKMRRRNTLFKKLPNYAHIQPYKEESGMDFDFFSFPSNRRRGDFNILEEPSVISMTNQTEEQKRTAFRYIFRNLHRSSSEFLTYPYQLTWDDQNTHMTWPDGAFIDMIPENVAGYSQSSFHHFETSENITFFRSKAIYDINIAVMKVEVTTNGVYKNLFYESDTYCAATITYIGHWGVECLRANDFVSGGNTKFVFLNTSDVDIIDVKDFKILIFPDIIAGEEDLIIDLFGPNGIAKVRKFVEDGGLIYATGKSGYILERFGIFSQGVYNRNRAFISATNVAKVKGCEVNSDPNSLVYADYVKQMMCLFTPDDIYILSSYRSTPSNDPNINVLLHLDETDSNLRLKNMNTGFTYTNLGTNNIPLILHKSFGKGNVITTHANPNYHTDYFVWFYNTLFMAMGKNFAYDQNVNFANGKAIPAMESGVIMTINTAFYNVFNTDLIDLEMKFWLPENVLGKGYTSDGICVKEHDVILPRSRLNESYYVCTWNLVEKYSKIYFNLEVEILDASVTQLRTDVLMGYTIVKYNNSRSGSQEIINIGDFLIDTEVAALLRCNVNPDPSSFYPIKGRGNYIDNVMPCENKEDTNAYDVEHIAIVPLVSPSVDGGDQSKLIEIIRFWNEYYEKSRNEKEEYPFPFRYNGEYDILDFKYLSGKGVLFNANWDTPVKLNKEDRDHTYPTIMANTSLSMRNINYSTNIGTTNTVLRQTHFANADSYFEHATQQLLVFSDTTTEEGANGKYDGNVHGRLGSERIKPGHNVEKVEFSWIRADIYFYDSLDQYLLPSNILPEHVISIDRYPKYPSCDNGLSKIMENGYFNKSQPGGLKENEWGNEVTNRCDKTMLDYETIDSFTNGGIQKTRYLFPIAEDYINEASDIMDFNETSGELFEYPEVKFIKAHKFILPLAPEISRKGGYIEFILPYDFKSGSEANVFFQADHVAFYDTKVDIPSRTVTAKFKRGLMPNEAWGKESIQQVIIENLDTTIASFNVDVDIHEMKYDITSSTGTLEKNYFIETRNNVEVLRKNFFSLPAIRMHFKLNRTGDTSMKGYELIEPLARYGVYYQELLKHRTVWGLAESHHISDPGQTSSSGGFSLISQVGISSIPFLEYLTAGSGQVIPAALETSRVEWTDIWDRRFVQVLRSVFPDVPPIPPPLRNFMMTTTFEITDPVTGERQLEWNSDFDMDIKVQMKLKNNYPKFFEITECKDNQVFSIPNIVRSRIFDTPAEISSYQTTSVTNWDEYLSLGHTAFYGNCWDHPLAILSGQSLTPEEVDKLDELWHCSANLWNSSGCVLDLKSIPTISRRKTNPPDVWNFSPKVWGYYPSNYIKDNMADLTHYDYDDNAFDKAYKYHMDNDLPNLDQNIIKPHNIIAAPLWKGYGYEITYDKEHSVIRYPSYQGWWSDNLQNKDDTLLAGQLNSNDISVDKGYENLITASDWIEINNLNPTATNKGNRRTSHLGNIYTCLFNRHRIRMHTNNPRNYYENNVYQNNVVPIIPRLNKNDPDLTSFSCDLGDPQYTHETISSVDNRVYTTDGRDWLYFAANLRGGAKETINAVMKLHPFEERRFEGDTKVNDGGRFVYWNPANGPNSFLIVDNPVNVVKGTRCDIDFESELFPKSTSTFNSQVYHLFSISDTAEIDRAYNYPFYINHYGFGDVTTSIYVGGTEGSSAILQPGDTTYAKVTIYNNAGYDFQLLQMGIDFVYEGTKQLNAYDLLMNIAHAIKVPIRYNFMKLSIPSELQNYITIIPSDHNKYVASLFFDFQNINTATIVDGFKADYFYKITLDAAIPDELRGRLHEISITLNETCFEALPGYNDKATHHDYNILIPAIKFGIPFETGNALVNIEHQGKVFYSSGESTEIELTTPIDSRFNILDVRYITKNEIETLRTIVGDPHNMVNDMAAFYDTLDTTTINYIENGYDSNGFINYQFDLLPTFDSLPKKNSIYQPPQSEVFILIKSIANELDCGYNVVQNNPRLSYNACGKSLLYKQSQITTPLYRGLYASGPLLECEYDSTLIERFVGTNVIENSNQLLYPHDSGRMILRARVTNIGSDVAYNIVPSFSFDMDVDILLSLMDSLYIYNVTYDVYGNKMLLINTQYDLAPGMMEVFEIYLNYYPNRTLIGRTDYENFPTQRHFIFKAKSDIDLTSIPNENKVTQNLNIFSMQYSLRDIDSVTLTGIEDNDIMNNCEVQLTAIANYPIVDGNSLLYSFYKRNLSDVNGRWNFIRRSSNNIINVNDACYSMDFMVETINPLDDQNVLANDIWMLNLGEIIAIATAVALGLVILFCAFFLFLIAIMVLLIYGFDTKDSELSRLTKRFTKRASKWIIRGKFGWFETGDEAMEEQEYYVGGRMVKVIDKVRDPQKKKMLEAKRKKELKKEWKNRMEKIDDKKNKAKLYPKRKPPKPPNKESLDDIKIDDETNTEEKELKVFEEEEKKKAKENWEHVKDVKVNELKKKFEKFPNVVDSEK